MGQTGSNPLRENLESLHTQLMKQGGADYDIATATTLTYDHFLLYIAQLNQICKDYKDLEGNVLVFAVKKGTDSTIFWKATVRIACVKLSTTTNKVQSYRLLNVRQFLQVFRRITYECIGGSLGEHDSVFDSIPAVAGQTSALHERESAPLPPTMAASLVLGEQHEENASEAIAGKFSKEFQKEFTSTSTFDECVICLERRTDVILPCAHAYCLPCIEQWWEYSMPSVQECSQDGVLFAMNGVDKTCPVCRETLKSTEDTWVISEAPDNEQVNNEIRRTLMGLAEDNE